MREPGTLGWREVGRETLSGGFIHLIRWRGQFERFAGGWSAVVEREIVLRGEAVDTVLARLDDGAYGNRMTLIALQWLAVQRARGHWVPAQPQQSVEKARAAQRPRYINEIGWVRAGAAAQ